MRIVNLPNWDDVDLTSTITAEEATPPASILLLRQLDDAILAVAATYGQPALLFDNLTPAVGTTRQVLMRVPPGANTGRARIQRCAGGGYAGIQASSTVATTTGGLTGADVVTKVCPLFGPEVYCDTGATQWVGALELQTASDVVASPSATLDRALPLTPLLASAIEVVEVSHSAGVCLYVDTYEDLETL